jgi:hypothetical protein
MSTSYATCPIYITYTSSLSHTLLEKRLLPAHQRPSVGVGAARGCTLFFPLTRSSDRGRRRKTTPPRALHHPTLPFIQLARTSLLTTTIVQAFIHRHSTWGHAHTISTLLAHARTYAAQIALPLDPHGSAACTTRHTRMTRLPPNGLDTSTRYSRQQPILRGGLEYEH